MSKRKGSAPQGATIWLDRGWIMVRTPYDRKFVDELKANISSAHRKWDPDEKLWKVDPSQDELLTQLLEKFFGTVTVLEDKEIVVVGDADDPYGEMLKLAPNDTLKKVYRLMATALHPDKGGSAKDMTRLNGLWAKIRADRGM